jgi:hypothetical protein
MVTPATESIVGKKRSEADITNKITGVRIGTWLGFAL